MVLPARAMGGPGALGLDDETRSRFLHDNAQRVFGL
jgi:predicted TIM-barrel fold metal-dependent hydrolase